MSIVELTQKIESAGLARNHEQRMKLLREARVLDAKGRFDSNFFRPEQGNNSSAPTAVKA